MKIIKYNLDIVGEQSIDTHTGFIILTTQLQYNKIVLWAMVDELSEPVERKFAMYETGDEVNSVDVYVGSVQTHDPKTVQHIFEIFDES